MSVFNNNEAKKNYDENGNWCTDYENMEVSFDKLRIPENEKDFMRFHKRFMKECGAFVEGMTRIPNKVIWSQPSMEEEYEKGPILEGYEEWSKEGDEEEEDDDETEYYQIIFGKYPTMNDKVLYYDRPILIATFPIPSLPDKHAAMMITSIGNKKVDRYDAILKDWKEEGLKKKSAAKCDSIRSLDMIKVRRHVGFLTMRDVVTVTNKIFLFQKEAFNNPWNFLNWCIMVNVTNSVGEGKNNIQKIKSLEDISNNHDANCVDIAIAVYQICKSAKIDATIGWVKFIYNEHKTRGHLFCVFKHKGAIYSFQYIPDIPLCRIEKYDDKEYIEVIKKEGDIIHSYIDKHEKAESDVRYYEFDKSDLKKCTDTVYLKTHNQRQFLDSVWPDTVV